MKGNWPPDPPPERVGAEVENSATPEKQISTWARDRFWSENTGSPLSSQSRLVSMDEGAEILGEYLPRYLHQESSEWSDGWNWRDNRATPKQIECLRRFGIDARGARMGHCSRLIGKLLRRKEKGLASFDDLRWLCQHGVDNARKLTARGAGQLIEIISNNLAEAGAQRLEGGLGCSV